MTDDIRTTARNATLQDLAELLKDQHTRKFDVVAPATAIRSDSGVLVIEGTEAQLSADGVTATEGRYRPTAVADEGIAQKLGIPVGYLKNLRHERPDLYDANVNGWLRGFGHEYGIGGNIAEPRTRAEPDPRSFLVRCFRPDEGEGVARAFLSDSYKVIDNLDVLTAALEGVRKAGLDVSVEACDLTERKMYVRIVAPAIKALAPVLLANYRSPFDGVDEDRARTLERHGYYRDDDAPVVFAGFILANSETGCGAYSLTPRLVVQRCRNGLTITADALRSVHLGGKLDEGVVRWSEDTMQRNLELVSSQARDAVATFLDPDYVKAKVEEIERKAGKRLESPRETVETVGKKLRFSQDRIDGVLDHFIRGGDPTAGGVMQAVTSFAQTVENADEAFDMEAQAINALELAANA